MKKILSLMLVLAMVMGCVVFIACSGGESKPTPSTPAPSSSSETPTPPAEEPEYASPIVDSALQSLSNGDYTTHVNLFIEELQGQLTEATFQQAHQIITGRIGTYVNKSFERVQQEGIYEAVYYQSQFTDEPDAVRVKALFQGENGEMKLAGFWLDSPKLRG